MLSNVTPLILTYNESCNIGRVLDRLIWAKRIVIIDSYSTDDTKSIVTNYPQVELFERTFDTFANQCNYGLSLIETEWILSLDADYICPPEFIEEISAIPITTSKFGYYARFIYCIYGNPLRGTLYPPRTVLYRREAAQYVLDGHAHRVQIDGDNEVLKTPIWHDDWKPLNSWIKAQIRYSAQEAKKLVETSPKELGRIDRMRKWIILVPPLTPFYCLFWKRLILDGWKGIFYTLQRTVAEILLSLCLLEYNLKVVDDDESNQLDMRIP